MQPSQPLPYKSKRVKTPHAPLSTWERAVWCSFAAFCLVTVARVEYLNHQLLPSDRLPYDVDSDRFCVVYGRATTYYDQTLSKLYFWIKGPGLLVYPVSVFLILFGSYVAIARLGPDRAFGFALLICGILSLVDASWRCYATSGGG